MAKKTKTDVEGQEEETVESFAHIDGFDLVNPDKLERVIYGNMGRAGTLEGGLGEDAKPSLVLAHYDKIGGLIKKDGTKIKNGSFWDNKKKVPRETPEVLYLYNVGGEIVEVSDPSELAAAVNTLNQSLAEKEAQFKEKKAKSKLLKDPAGE